MNSLTNNVNIVADRIHADRSDGTQMLVAIVGAPGAGKSTLAQEVARRLNQQKCPTLVLPMDGFHLDNAVLDALNLTARKGAPDTFDASGLLRMVTALSAGQDIYFPRFDRTRDISIAGALAVSAAQPVVIIEGNYLMYDAPVWRELAAFWDLTVRVDVPLPELRARLIQRWLSLNHSPPVATRRAEGNDIPNAQSVIAQAIACDVNLPWAAQD